MSLLRNNGFELHWLRREPAILTASVAIDGASTRLEWVRDSDFRFFPTLKDPAFGYRLHLFDIATNKALAAAGREEPRDVLDLIHLNDHHVPLGAVIWAAIVKDPGFTPEGLIAEIRRNARYRADDYADLDLVEPVDAGDIARRLRMALSEAESFVRQMPSEKAGLVFLAGERPVQPDPKKLDQYVQHIGTRKGHWPTSSEIGHQMIK